VNISRRTSVNIVPPGHPKKVFVRGVWPIPKRLQRPRVLSSGSKLLVLGGAMDCLPLLGRVAQDLWQSEVGTVSSLHWGHQVALLGLG
jgi:hypothetical protein